MTSKGDVLGRKRGHVMDLEFSSRTENIKKARKAVTNTKQFMNYIGTCKNDILIHVMKIYYYYRYYNKIDNPQWTFKHWMDEILVRFKFTTYPNFNTKDFDKDFNFDWLYKKLTDNIDRNEIIPVFLRKMDEGNGVLVHKLPPIKEHEVRTKWRAFIILYRKFILDLLECVENRQKEISEKKALGYIRIAASKITENAKVLDKLTLNYQSFSTLEDDLLELCKKYNLKTI